MQRGVFVEYGGVSVEHSAVVVNNSLVEEIGWKRLMVSLAGERCGGVELCSRAPPGVRERTKNRLHAEWGDLLESTGDAVDGAGEASGRTESSRTVQPKARGLILRGPSPLHPLPVGQTRTL